MDSSVDAGCVVVAVIAMSGFHSIGCHCLVHSGTAVDLPKNTLKRQVSSCLAMNPYVLCFASINRFETIMTREFLR